MVSNYYVDCRRLYSKFKYSYVKNIQDFVNNKWTLLKIIKLLYIIKSINNVRSLG